MSAPVFVIDGGVPPAARSIWLEGPEGHHAANVLRLRAGEPVDLTDGAGLRAHGVVAEADRSRLLVDVLDRSVEDAPSPRVVVVQALPKGDRGERAVEVLTEVGVDEIVPWAAARCVTQWRGERGSRALGKWRDAARSAAKQSRRWWHPTVGDVVTTAHVVTRLAGATLPVALHESGTVDIGALAVPASGEVVVVVGPEGGLTDDEVATFVAAGAHIARLGPTVLRTSTAGVVAAGVVLARTDRWRSTAG